MTSLIPILGLILSFFAGTIPVGPLLARWNQIDLRSVGSGNVGATNVYRALGLGWAMAAFVGDAVKGLVPTLALRLLIPEDPVYLAGGVLAVAGHIFNPLLGGKGGKGVATGFGSMLAISPLAAAGALLVWLAIMGIKRLVSLASVTAALVLPALTLALCWHEPGWDRWTAPAAAVAIMALVLASHRANLGRLIRGEEEAITRESGNDHPPPGAG